MSIYGKTPYVSLATRLRRFWNDNPGEELSISDIARKFSVSERTATNAVRAVHHGGMPIDRVSIYRPRGQ